MKPHLLRPARVSSLFALALLALGLLLLSTAPRARAATASAPDYMTYQGFLVDAAGTPLATNTPANYPVNFRIYNAPVGGALIWSELQVVTVDKGQFSVVLGEGTAITGEPAGARPTLSQVFTNATASDLFIEIEVSINSTLQKIQPRLRLVSSPYAFTSASANRLVAANNGSTFVSYNAGATRAEVTGNLFVSGTISGNGSGLTGLTPSQIPALNASSITSGTLGDGFLSVNVARRNSGNAFSGGNQTITGGNLGVGTTTPNFGLSLGGGFANTKLALYDAGASSAFGLGAQSGQFRFHLNTSADRFSFLSDPAGTEIATLSGGGNLGIGTNSPQARLHISSSSAPAQIVDSSATAGTSISLRNASVGGREWNVISSGSGNAEGAGKLLIRDQATATSVVQVEATPSPKVTVNGSLSVSGAVTIGTDSLASGRENLRIIRGRVSGAGVAVGTANGWSVSGAAGVYTLTFPAGTFSEPPAVTATAFSTDPCYATIANTSATSCTVYVRRDFSSASLPVPESFHFIAIGAR